MEQKKIKVCAYCRVSTNSKDQENSFENQKSYFEREITNSEDYELIQIYADKGITGTSLTKREAFNRMLEDAGIDIIPVHNKDKDRRLDKIKFSYVASSSRNPKFNIIFVKNTSRFARNVLIQDILRELKKKEVYVYFLDINKSTENDSDELILQFMFTFDENESKDKSRKVRFGLREGAEKGVILVNSQIYGYHYIKETNSLEIIPNEAEVIRKIFELYSNGYGVRRIYNYLDENGIVTRKGKSFGKTSIQRILDNEKYAGINARLKYDSGTVFNKYSYAKIRDRSEWIIHKNSRIPSIIDIELFEKCQEIKHSKVHSKLQKGIYKGISEYAGLIYCDKCGNHYISNVDRGRRFFNCRLKKDKGISACNNPNISLKRLEQVIIDEGNFEFERLFDQAREEYIQRLEKLKSLISQKIDIDKSKEVKLLMSKLEDLNKESKRLLDLYLKNLFDMETLDSSKRRLDEEVSKTQAMISHLSKGNDEIKKDIQEIDATIDKINDIRLKYNYTKDDILSEIDRIIVDEEGGLNIKYKALSFLEEVTQKYSDIILEDYMDEFFRPYA